SEWNIVVKAVEISGTALAGRRLLLWSRCTATTITTTLLPAIGRLGLTTTTLVCRFSILTKLVILHTAAGATGIEHLHFAGHDFGGVAGNAVLFPRAGTQAALNVEFAALAHVFVHDLGQTVEEHNTVPLGFFLRLSGVLVFPGLAGRQSQVGHCATAGQITGFRIPAYIAYQNNFVYAATCHLVVSF